MIRFERSFDYPLIRKIVTHPKVYPHICDDASPPAAEYRPLESEAVWYIVARDGDEILGLWILHPHNSICWELHICMLPNAWGERAAEVAHSIWDWIWDHAPCRRVIAHVPEHNRLVYRFVLRSGMVEYGVNKASFLHNGRLCNQICLGISPPSRQEALGSIREEALVCHGQR